MSEPSISFISMNQHFGKHFFLILKGVESKSSLIVVWDLIILLVNLKNSININHTGFVIEG